MSSGILLVLFADLNRLNTTIIDYVVYGDCGQLAVGGTSELWAKYCESSRDSADPRLVVANWLLQWNQRGDLAALPFNWADFLSLHPYEGNCNSLAVDLDVPQYEIMKYCVDMETAVITAALNLTTSPDNYRVIGERYLTNSPIPLQIGLVLDNMTVVLPTVEGSMPPTQPLIHYPSEIRKFRAHIDHLPKLTDVINNEPVIVQSSINPILLKNEFIYNESLLLLSLAPFGNIYDKNLFDAYNLYRNTPTSAKYFHEPKLKHAGHFDWRFFKKLDYSEYERIALLHKLARAWFQFASSVGIKSWLAHGTMLGWYWNGANLPWDNDLDLQTTTESLFKLARLYNQTLVVQLNDDSFGQYLIDVNPSIFDRNKSEGNNVIDARFIDIHTGFYIDITALSYTESAKSISISKKQLVEFNRLLDPEFIENERSQTLLISDLNRKLFNKRADLCNNKEIYNCKNNHFYSYQELSPLKPTLFEGVITFVPNGYQGILKREYPKGLYYRTYNNYNWDPLLRVWVDNRVCKLDKPCKDPEQLKYSQVYQEMTYIHKQNMYYKMDYLQELRSMMVDPWLIKRFLQVHNIR